MKVLGLVEADCVGDGCYIDYGSAHDLDFSNIYVIILIVLLISIMTFAIYYQFFHKKKIKEEEPKK